MNTNQGNQKFSMNLDAYLLEMYQEQGHEFTLAAINDVLKQWEEANIGPTNKVYEMDGAPMTREEYAQYTVETIGAYVHALSQCQPTEYQNEDWEAIENLEIIKHLELLLGQYYDNYRAITREINGLMDKREEIAEYFAKNASHWAHLKFRKPSPSKESVALYTMAKQTQLKAIAPGYGFFRGLAIKTKQVDEWTRIEDDPTVGAGICNLLDEFGNHEPQDQYENFV
ncbi:hypothetical protein G6F70_009450 [Rhizopus microsporus]|nr:hypothetical protein G6F71_009463 [Rhizopus microsporus]KAG1189488.1 hypothetical protein G6F70_009450 [Rhizopus microsporus]KAG1205390.1 hypothetical protein G6F69_009423 [Rhizopus microsporus]KAG1224574.1 hypothetical protein G6F67_009487 [Rhizopus microsporus]KAG1250871.1 hypothetical protein G6F68_012569 [Rhizopus microsporus]